ncbi:MFS transporter, partial [Streptomyces violascens]
DSVGAGYAVAQGIGEQAKQLGAQALHATTPQQAAQLKAQAEQLGAGAQQMSHAVGSAFSDAVAHTSLIGAVILGVGTVLVAALLPRRDKGDAQQEQASDGSEREPVSV